MADPFANPKGDPGTEFIAGFDSDCDECGAPLFEGDTMYALHRGYICQLCWEDASGIDLQ